MPITRKIAVAAAGATAALLAAIAPAVAQPTAAHSTAPVAQTCRDAARSITGAKVTGYICWDADEVWFEPVSDAYLTDTAKDGRRAELWSTDSWQGPRLQIQITSGANTGESIAGYWWGAPGSTSSVRLRLCTSDAGLDRTCGAWY